MSMWFRQCVWTFGWFMMPHRIGRVIWMKPLWHGKIHRHSRHSDFGFFEFSKPGMIAIDKPPFLHVSPSACSALKVHKCPQHPLHVALQCQQIATVVFFGGEHVVPKPCARDENMKHGASVSGSPVWLRQGNLWTFGPLPSAGAVRCPLVQKTRQFGGCQRNMNWILLWQKSILPANICKWRSKDIEESVCKDLGCCDWCSVASVVYVCQRKCPVQAMQCTGSLGLAYAAKGEKKKARCWNRHRQGPQKTSYNKKSFPDCITCMHLYAVYRCNVYSYIITSNWYQLYKYNQYIIMNSFDLFWIILTMWCTVCSFGPPLCWRCNASGICWSRPPLTGCRTAKAAERPVATGFCQAARWSATWRKEIKTLWHLMAICCYLLLCHYAMSHAISFVFTCKSLVLYQERAWEVHRSPLHSSTHGHAASHWPVQVLWSCQTRAAVAGPASNH